MSPFEAVNERLVARVASLELPAQVALFASAAEALVPRYLDWVAGSGGSALDRLDLLRQAIYRAQQFALGEPSATDGELLLQVAGATPGSPTHVDWFTAAQDCWICADTALRSSLGQFEAQESVWYLLEPIFQRTSERLYGYTDVGSVLQGHLEGQALEDEALQRAVTALDRAVDLLSSGAVDRPLLARLSLELAAITP